MNFTPEDNRNWIYLGVFFLLLGYLNLVLSAFVTKEDWILNSVFCLTSGSMIAWRVRLLYHSDLRLLIADHRWVFSLAFLLYYVVGAAFFSFGDDATISSLMLHFSTDASLAARVNSVNGIGFGIALILASTTPSPWLKKTALATARRFGSTDSSHPYRIRKSLLLFFCIGGAATGYVTMTDLGLLSSGPVAGLWRVAANLLLVFVFVANFYDGKNSVLLKLVAFLTALTLSFVGIVSFSKTGVILPLLLFGAGYSLQRQSLKLLAVVILFGIIIFKAISDPLQLSRHARFDHPSIMEKVNVVIESQEVAKLIGEHERYSVWSRLSYITSQSAAITFYDQGNGGNDLELIPWILVPRFMFPQKPIITRTGTDFYQKITGNFGSSEGMGIFVNGYYNSGWLGVFLWATLSGVVIAWTSTIAKAVLVSDSRLLYPFALFGTYIAFRIDGTLVADYLGAFVIMLYGLIFLRYFPRFSH